MPKFRMIDNAGAQIKATSVCVLGRQITADKDGLLEMTETEAVVLGKSYHVVGQNGAELSPEAKLEAQKRADEFAERQRAENEKRKSERQAQDSALLEAAALKAMEPLTAEEVLEAGYLQEQVQSILDAENPIRARVKDLVAEGMTFVTAREQAEKEAEEGKEETKLPTASQLGKMNKAGLLAQADAEKVLVGAGASNAQMVEAILAARPKE